MTDYPCDCRVCRYHDKPFTFTTCPHPSYPHADSKAWTEYANTDDGRTALASHKDQPRRSTFGEMIRDK